jgi:hypothetical protein
VNNVFYQPFCNGNGTFGGTDPIIKLSSTPSGLRIVGNVYMRNSDNGCELLRVASVPFGTISDMRASSLERIGSTNYGEQFSNVGLVMTRIRNIVRPQDNSYTNNMPNGMGDFVNAFSIAVNLDDTPLDSVFNSPGLEVPIGIGDDVSIQTNDAYQYQLNNPIGKFLKMWNMFFLTREKKALGLEHLLTWCIWKRLIFGCFFPLERLIFPPFFCFTGCG